MLVSSERRTGAGACMLDGGAFAGTATGTAPTDVGGIDSGRARSLRLRVADDAAVIERRRSSASSAASSRTGDVSVSVRLADALRGHVSPRRCGRNEVRLSGSCPNDVDVPSGASIETALVFTNSGGAGCPTPLVPLLATLPFAGAGAERHGSAARSARDSARCLASASGSVRGRRAPPDVSLSLRRLL